MLYYNQSHFSEGNSILSIEGKDYLDLSNIADAGKPIEITDHYQESLVSGKPQTHSYGIPENYSFRSASPSFDIKDSVILSKIDQTPLSSPIKSKTADSILPVSAQSYHVAKPSNSKQGGTIGGERFIRKQESPSRTEGPYAPLPSQISPSKSLTTTPAQSESLKKEVESLKRQLADNIMEKKVLEKV